MGCCWHKTREEAEEAMRGLGFAPVADDILPVSWRGDVGRYWWHAEREVCGIVAPRADGWDALWGLSSDSTSRTLARAFRAKGGGEVAATWLVAVSFARPDGTPGKMSWTVWGKHTHAQAAAEGKAASVRGAGYRVDMVSIVKP